ncbi:cysteine desulfurase NifS [Candidatus Wirthbacteria bacterium CG2_30_54_11]|uniref:Cysteine desulfurase NifS n=1 Tax=Candidatus Wirthbacteria bacterium CG2_30_54_11 TaxID=1817892 RepID=A0A1J5IUH3_9BACT|nr:MAG: cysteine desulfurase NifS [Candidatus Wirthbacteria bacterium CG2_30_54_11]
MSDARIYLDHGATTPVDPQVIEAMNEVMLTDFGNPSSAHQFGAQARKYLTGARLTIARLINASPDEIVFNSGGSESDTWALRGVAYANRSRGNHLITTVIEHPAVLETARQLEKEGFQVTFLPVDSEGFIDPKELEKAITPATILVSIMAANNEIGTIQDLDRIGSICKKHDVYFHSDAVQAFTKTPLDVKAMNISLLSLTAHKIHGPKGVGCLYIRKGTRIDKMVFGGHQENNKRAGTENVPGIVGFGKAAELAAPKYIGKMTELRDHFIARVEKEIPDVRLNGPRGDKRLCNNVNISFLYIEGEGILMHLDMYGIGVSTGSACSSQNLEPSHVLTAIGLLHEQAHGSIRFTLGRENTRKQIDFTIDHLKEVIAKLRAFSSLREGVIYDATEEVHH